MLVRPKLLVWKPHRLKSVSLSIDVKVSRYECGDLLQFRELPSGMLKTGYHSSEESLIRPGPLVHPETMKYPSHSDGPDANDHESPPVQKRRSGVVY